MLLEKVQIINKLGLHARAAAKFVSTATNFASTIKVTCNGKTVDGKSIMSVMMLAAAKGAELELRIDGSDEDKALECLKNLINDCFSEDE